MQTPYGDDNGLRRLARAGETAGVGADGGDSTDGGDEGDGGREAATPAEYQTTPLCRQSRQSLYRLAPILRSQILCRLRMATTTG